LKCQRHAFKPLVPRGKRGRQAIWLSEALWKRPERFPFVPILGRVHCEISASVSLHLQPGVIRTTIGRVALLTHTIE